MVESHSKHLSPARAFHSRRERLAGLLKKSGVELAWLVAGYSRPKNFPQNRHPFRAESHFLYLVGRHLEGAVLEYSLGNFTLYMQPPDPEDALWSGPEPSLQQLSALLELPVRPLSELEARPEITLLPPQDADTAIWLAEKLDRDVVAGGGDRLEGAEALLADAMIELRLRHDAAAIEQLRWAAQVTRRAHDAGMLATSPGVSEVVVRSAMEQAIIACGLSTSYQSIVTVHGEVLHNHHYQNILRAGDLLLADVGAETAEGWAGDITRTWPVSGKFSSTQLAIYQVVLQAQEAAISALRPGVRYLEVHRLAGREMLKGLSALGLVIGDPEELYQVGLGGLFFPHGIGHLLGLDVHDMEDLGDRAGYAPGRSRLPGAGDRFLRLDRDLEPGMAVTIEPGFYQIPGLTERGAAGKLAQFVNWDELSRFKDVRGIRIEDDVLITDSGYDILTDFIVKQPAQVEALVQEGQARGLGAQLSP